MGFGIPSIKKDLTHSALPPSGLRRSIDINKFWATFFGEGTVDPESLHTCVKCGIGQAVVTPKTNGDWYFSCLSCYESWNLCEHIKTLVPIREVRGWLVGSGAVGEFEVDQYMSHSRSVVRINELLQLSKEMDSARRPKDSLPMETVIVSPQMGVCMFAALGKTNMFIRNKKNWLRAAIYRDCFGVISKLTFHSFYNWKQIASAVLVDSVNHFYCTHKDGFKIAEKLYIMSARSSILVDASLLSPQENTLIARDTRAISRVSYPFPWMEPPIVVTIISTEKTIDRDMQLFGSLFSLKSTRVIIADEDGKKISEDYAANVLFKSNCYSTISRGFIKSGMLSKEALDSVGESERSMYFQKQHL